ncbi:hypothetical protein SNOG_00481 [Parastagonospora nodorum SN15]|uniref:Uncharacterized protein n=1 Tax=Phaeosphaeria nodorum (strain SN15 / ATCC MYA-4574 / FGSC 10173) TaxID=321614 RepID=Q0V683_PHANO|nr:hypothetical protein SNOG_00481 [Parastagonospora nodorum SN15]EAT91976.1 hypothetical protein SNOG_00481 [Parastagonospora nodorum SN15]
MGAVVRAQLMVLVLVRGVVVWWCSSSSRQCNGRG